ncbi:hypothetical protein [Streptomyces sp. ISL-100]|uniref:hypothetical protein n=1 Tax=Streptomyces sp. ISL-100 TaxID=2819173 RepID=UPI001BEB3E7F|nr:hypothetical protein [Streptomyces sp. ISL-100]MBT2397612.1 hypothetical protein [Streptomyces sp. ISL-100]
MVTSSHEAMHRILQEAPGAFTRTFRALDLPFDDPVAVTLLPTDRVDALLRFDTADPASSFLLAVQAQEKEDPARRASWVYSLTRLNVEYGVPPVLLVVCQDRNTAAWAAEPVDIGLPQWPALTMRPLVLGPHNVPALTDPAAAARDILLATLSAITHGKAPEADAVLKALAAGLRAVDRDTASIVIELAELGLGTAPAAQIWRDLMVIEGRLEARTEDILLMLTRRGIEIPDNARHRITSCTDLDTLSAWLTRTLTATSAEDLFADD